MDRDQIVPPSRSDPNSEKEEPPPVLNPPPSDGEMGATPKEATAHPQPGIPVAGLVVPEQEQKFDYLISTPMRSASHLMDALYHDDTFYESARFAWVGAADAKKLFLYGVCKEVTKTSVGMLEDKEHLQDIPDAKKPDRMTKLVIGAITDVQTYRIRKMVELLSILILFDRNAKRDEEYRVFLNTESLDLELARLDDFRQLYSGRVIANIQHSVNGFADRIRQDLGGLGVGTLWFLKMGSLKKNLPGVFASKKAVYLQALLAASPDERIALGISYGRGYSRTSQAVHPLLGSHDYGREDNDARHMRANFTYLGIITMHIMRLAHKLAGVDDPEGLDKIMGANFEKSEASKAIGSFRKEFEVGDIVLTAWTDIAEILDTHTGKYGYIAYRVKYISRAPIPEISDDWLESQGILLRLMPKSAIRDVYEKAVASEKYPKEVQEIMPEVLKLPDEKLIEYAGRTFLEMHRAGVLIPMLVRQGYLKRTSAETE